VTHLVLHRSTAVSILRLPLSSVIIALLLTSRAGLATTPIIIVSVLVAYITTETLSATRLNLSKQPLHRPRLQLDLAR
jgi:hypothetical protein